MVLFLGAGASRACGYLLTDEILPRIGRVLHGSPKRIMDGRLRQARKELLATLEAYAPGACPPQRRLSAARTMSVTDLLSFLDHAIRNGEEISAGREGQRVDGDSLRRARQILVRAIVEVLREPFHSVRIEPRRLVEWARKASDGPVTVVSTNYDASFDFAAFDAVLGNWQESYWRADFGFSWRDPDDGSIVPPPGNSPSGRARLRLFKLHGSLNWMRCPRCGFVYVNFQYVIAAADAKKGWDAECHCGWRPLRSVLVAPSLARDTREPSLLSLWLAAGEALRTATSWVFAGYSLPPEDLAIRSMLVRAYQGAPRPKPVIQVVDVRPEPDRDEQPGCVARYAGFFPGVQWTNDGVEGLVNGTERWRSVV